MGQQIEQAAFSEQDYHAFHQHLADEYQLLRDWLADGCFDDQHLNFGLELEFQLLNEKYRPAPSNLLYMDNICEQDDYIFTEVCQCALEINSRPYAIDQNMLINAEDDMQYLWQHCCNHADSLDLIPACIGILPTAKASMNDGTWLTNENRYYSLEQQLANCRNNKSVNLNIQGKDHLQMQLDSIAVIGTSCSFQIHTHVPISQFSDYYNVALMIAAPIVAIGSNSPFLFNNELWQETRIALFEKMINTSNGHCDNRHRVRFAQQYLKGDLLPLLERNLNFPVLLPCNHADELQNLYHLRLHNGTIWRWVRPVIGFNQDGTPHLRIEFRVLPGGPSLVDMLANFALYIGLVHALVPLVQEYTQRLAFEHIRDNFYKAAKYGLQTDLHWLDGKIVASEQLLINDLIPMAAQGLSDYGISNELIKDYLNIIEQRTITGRTGSKWQTDFYHQHGERSKILMEQYVCNQRLNIPVHLWEV